MLRTKSFDDMSMCDIAESASLSRRTLYNHFADKLEVYRASREQLLAELVGLLPDQLDVDAPISQALYGFGVDCARLIGDERHFELLLSIVRDGQSWLDQQFQKQIRRPMLATIECFLLDRMAAGQLHTLSPYIAATQFICSIEAAVLSARLFNPTTLSGEFLMEKLVRALVDGFILQHFREAGDNENTMVVAA